MIGLKCKIHFESKTSEFIEITRDDFTILLILLDQKPGYFIDEA